MANKFARANGDFNGPIWALTPGGVAGSTTAPTIDDVAFANSFVVSITGTTEVTSFVNGASASATAGGYFLVKSDNNEINLTGHVGWPTTSGTTNVIVLSGSQNISLSGNIYCGYNLPTGVAHTAIGVNSYCTNNTVSISGNIIMGGPTANIASGTNYGLLIQSTSNNTYNIFGSVLVPQQRNSQHGTAQNVRNLGPCTINLNGDVRGANGNISGDVTFYSQNGTVNHTGNVLETATSGGGVGGVIQEAVKISGGTYNLITGTLFSGSTYQYLSPQSLITITAGTANVTAGSIIGGSTGTYSNNYTPIIITGGTANVIGNLIAGTSRAAINQTGGTLNIVGNATCSNLAVNAITSSSGRMSFSGNINNAPNGIPAVYAASYTVNPVPYQTYIRYANNGTGVGSDAYLYYYTTDSLSAFSVPPVSAVRAGVQYANNTLIGTCQMPAASAVTFGALVDNTTGTAAITSNNLFDVSVASLTATNSLGERLKNSATVESVGKIIASFSN